MNKQQKLFLYSSVFIALAVNSPKLVALDTGSFVAKFWQFDLFEFFFQTVLNFFFCLSVFIYNRDRYRNYFTKWEWKRQGLYLLINMVLLGGFGLFGILIQLKFFVYGVLPGSGYFFRFLISMALIMIEMRIFMLAEQTESKTIENAQLRSSFLNTQLELLKGQLNPHFLYNALSSLSGIVSENPQLAKKYIGHLSKFFRYSLQESPQNFISLKDEIAALNSYAELMKMRHEDGLLINIKIEEPYYKFRLPHMSLQPLVENAIKHNVLSANKRLYVCVYVEDSYLVVKNNLQLLSLPEQGTGIGLANLNERCKILVNKEIEIVKTDTHFFVKVPLIQ